MHTYLIVGIAGGIIFAMLDFVLNVNPLAQRLSEPYRPLARKSMPMAAAVTIDILSGMAMAGIFLLLRPSFPGGPLIGAGVSFGILAWFFRVLMGALSQWVMFQIPARTHLYNIVAGLVEMLALGFFYAFALRSFP
jgi:hypothetical protein